MKLLVYFLIGFLIYDPCCCRMTGCGIMMMSLGISSDGVEILAEFEAVNVNEVSESIQYCVESGLPLAELRCISISDWAVFDTPRLVEHKCEGEVTTRGATKINYHNDISATTIENVLGDNTNLNDITGLNETLPSSAEINLLLDNLNVPNSEIDIAAFNKAAQAVNDLLSSFTPTDGQEKEVVIDKATRGHVISVVDSLVANVQIKVGKPVEISTNTIDIKVAAYNITNKNETIGKSADFSQSNGHSSFYIPLTTIHDATDANNTDTAPTRVGFVLYKNSLLFPSEQYKSNQVISATVDKIKENEILDEPVRFEMALDEEMKPSDNSLVCGFWDSKIDGWSRDGCVLKWNGSKPYCECEHLTNFAILVDIYREHDPNMPHDDVRVTSHDHGNSSTAVVDYISDMGCILSIVGLAITVFIHLIFPTLHKRRTQMILIHLCLCLFVAYLLFVIGIEATKRFVQCALVATLLHYFWLCAWCWMAVEGYTMYSMLVKVLGSATASENYMVKATVFAYVVPTVIVGVSAGYTLLYVDVESWAHSHGHEIHKAMKALGGNKLLERHTNFTKEDINDTNPLHDEIAWQSSYIGPNACWLWGPVLHFGFLLPVGLIMCFNAGTFIYVIYVLKKRKTKIQSTARKQKFRQQFINAVTMTMLLGLSWCFGFLAMISPDPTYQYVMHTLHTILSSLQGFALFILFCIRHNEVRNTWFNAVRNYFPCCPQPKPDTSALTRVYPCMDEKNHKHPKSMRKSNSIENSNYGKNNKSDSSSSKSTGSIPSLNRSVTQPLLSRQSSPSPAHFKDRRRTKSLTLKRGRNLIRQKSVNELGITVAVGSFEHVA